MTADTDGARPSATCCSAYSLRLASTVTVSWALLSLISGSYSWRLCRTWRGAQMPAISASARPVVLPHPVGSSSDGAPPGLYGADRGECPARPAAVAFAIV